MFFCYKVVRRLLKKGLRDVNPGDGRSMTGTAAGVTGRRVHTHGAEDTGLRRGFPGGAG